MNIEINLSLKGNETDLMGLFEMAYSLNKTVEKQGSNAMFFQQIIQQITPNCKKIIEAKGTTWIQYLNTLNASIDEQIEIMSK